MNLMVFSDLDGTLLDHETYSWEAALPALEALQRRQVPLVLASSKTAAEIDPIRARMGFAQCPAIVENGAFILEGGKGPEDVGTEFYTRLRDILSEAPSDLRACFSGFGDWSADDVAARTGLSLEDAVLAKLRAATEPGLWTGTETELVTFLEWLSEHGVEAKQGGRFLTLSVGGFDKGTDLRTLSGAMGDGPRATTVALGDAPNDIGMLEAADIAVIVANPGGAALPPLESEHDKPVIRTKKPGPEGWNEAMLCILEDLEN